MKKHIKDTHFTFDRHGYIIRLATPRKFTAYTLGEFRILLAARFKKIEGIAFTVSEKPTVGALVLRKGTGDVYWNWEICTDGLRQFFNLSRRATLPDTLYVTKV